MNASRLKEFLDLEAKNRIQESLNEVVNTLGRLAAEPQNASIQTEFAQQLDQFKASTASTQASIEPAKIPLLQEIGADKYFIRDFPAEISSSIRENPLTPAVTQQKLQPIRTERTQYIEQITHLRNLLDALGIKASVLQPGYAEIGFLLPRSLVLSCRGVR